MTSDGGNKFDDFPENQLTKIRIKTTNPFFYNTVHRQVILIGGVVPQVGCWGVEISLCERGRVRCELLYDATVTKR